MKKRDAGWLKPDLAGSGFELLRLLKEIHRVPRPQPGFPGF
ncbi:MULTISPECIES: hypothetical protein [Rhizobium/Agrobacterium group]|nr:MULTISPECIES: hypothetical protein [Rhizobium/Agrobacterium group]